MEKIDFNEFWQFSETEHLSGDEKLISFPYDTDITRTRDYDRPQFKSGSFYPPAVSYFYKELPEVSVKDGISLEIDGLLGSAEVYIGGEFVFSFFGRTRRLFDITKFYKAGRTVLIRIAGIFDAGAYAGNGIAGGISLVVSKKSDVIIQPYGIRMHSVPVGEKTRISAFTELKNLSGISVAKTALLEIFNKNGKRVAKKLKTIKLRANSLKTVEMFVNLKRVYEWSAETPYLYLARVSLLDGEKMPENYSETGFGIANRKLLNRAYRLNGKPLKLKGAVMTHDNGILGGANVLSAEVRKFQKVKELGYNAVRLIECPSQNTLYALDRTGLNCIVDIFKKSDGGIFSAEKIEASVKALRNHPSLAMICVADDAEESYQRKGGVETVKETVKRIREFMPEAIIALNAFERAPTAAEAERFGLRIPKTADKKQAIAIAREKEVFNKLTGDYFDAADVAGYTNLYPALSNENKRFNIGLCDAGNKAAAVFDETDRPGLNIGAFLNGAVDGLGGNPTVDTALNNLGDYDILLNKKATAAYKEAVFGKRTALSVSVQDPDSVSIESPDNFTDLFPIWNWPRHIGEPVKVVVFSGGDIVALYLNGKSVARKIAGKQNEYTAAFKVPYTPGKLEVISYYKGIEQNRVTLETVESPKKLCLSCAKKILNDGELAFVEIAALDKCGNFVPFASRPVSLEVSEGGELIALGNADPVQSAVNPCGTATEVSLYNGRALAVVKLNSSVPVTVTAYSDEMRTHKIVLKKR